MQPACQNGLILCKFFCGINLGFFVTLYVNNLENDWRIEYAIMAVNIRQLNAFHLTVKTP